LKHIYFAVTNDLVFDQRMHRICSSLAKSHYKITLVGRKVKTSLPLEIKPYGQKRLKCWFRKGFFFYAEFNVRLFLFLLFQKAHAICAIDLDTIIPCLVISRLKKIPRVYDAHEFFTEMKEVRERGFVRKIWTYVERFAVPKFEYCYTVSNGLAKELGQKYKRSFRVIRNLPYRKAVMSNTLRKKYLFYGGAVNEARGLEYLIPAMKYIPFNLVICGDGNIMDQLKLLIIRHQVQGKVELKGMVSPEELHLFAQEAFLGLNLVEKEGLNQYYSLANKFFDYIQAGLPQITMNFPEYASVNNEYEVAVLIDELSEESLKATINKTVNDSFLLERLNKNTLRAKEVFCWEKEEGRLIEIYNEILER
jgi:glycosyltransferase involved in cell wall biosynthesis